MAPADLTRLLIVNGNTDSQVTALLKAAAMSAVSSRTRVEAVTAGFGPRVIQTGADHAVAHRACIDAAQLGANGCDALVIGVSLDTALEELQATCAVPVVGMTSAALLSARKTGLSTGVVILGQTMKQMFLNRFAEHAPTHLVTIDLEPASALADREGAARLIVQGVARLAEMGAGIAIPVGATVTGLAGVIQPHVPILVLDSMACAVRQAERKVDELRGGTA